MNNCGYEIIAEVNGAQKIFKSGYPIPEEQAVKMLNRVTEFLFGKDVNTKIISAKVIYN